MTISSELKQIHARSTLSNLSVCHKMQILHYVNIFSNLKLNRHTFKVSKEAALSKFLTLLKRGIFKIKVRKGNVLSVFSRPLFLLKKCLL